MTNQPIEHLARKMLATAYADLAGIGWEPTRGIKAAHRDDAAWWFVEGGHEPWCYIIGIDPKLAFRRAQQIALGEIQILSTGGNNELQ